MGHESKTAGASKAPCWLTFCRIALFAATWLGLAATAIAAADVELTEEDLACLKCHDKPGLTKELANGDSLSLHVSTQDYLASMHNTTSCEDCHDDLDPATHGKAPSAFKTKRELTFKMQESCRTCHKKKYAQYDDSIHAATLSVGTRKAPLCANCHSSHTLRSVKVLAPIAETPCLVCHEEIYKAYAADVHGQERSLKGKAAPTCADCHRAHDVKAASLGNDVKDACLACHKDTTRQHAQWLPNTERHFDAVSCPACHAPDAQRRVNLRLFDAAAQRQVAETRGVPRFEMRARAADSGGLGLDERALWSLLKEFNQDEGAVKTTLRGRLEVHSGAQAHQLTPKARAIKECKTCHQAGAEPFQSVILTIAGADGRPLRHGIQKDVLSSLTAMNSVRGFYVIGSTRIKLLDTLLILVLAGSIVGPLLHMLVRRGFRAQRARRAAQRKDAAKPAPTVPAPPER